MTYTDVVEDGARRMAASGLIGTWVDVPMASPGEAAAALLQAGEGLAGVTRACLFTQATEGSGTMLLYELTDATTAQAVRRQLTEATSSRSGEPVLAALGSGTTQTYTLRVAHAATGSGDLLDAAYVLSVRLFVPEPWRVEVRRWLDEEHYPAQLTVPGCRWYHGYEPTEGRFNFLNLWGLDAPEVIDLPEWAAARDTPWRERLLPAFAETGRAVYRALQS